jgi:hypothetical protein
MSLTIAVVALVVIVAALALMLRGGVRPDRGSKANNEDAGRYWEGWGGDV